MKITELLSEIEIDSKVDIHNVDKESVKIPSMHAKYLTYRTQEKLILKSLNIEYSSLYKERWVFYTGKATPDKYKEENFDLKVMRGDVDIFLSADNKLAELKSRISVQETKVEAIDEYLKALMQRHWMLSNAIKWQNMMNGGMN